MADIDWDAVATGGDKPAASSGIDWDAVATGEDKPKPGSVTRPAPAATKPKPAETPKKQWQPPKEWTEAGQELGKIGQQAGDAINSIPYVGDAIRTVGQQAGAAIKDVKHNPFTAATAAAASLPGGLLGLGDDIARVAQSVTHNPVTPPGEGARDMYYDIPVVKALTQKHEGGQGVGELAGFLAGAPLEKGVAAVAKKLVTNTNFGPALIAGKVLSKAPEVAREIGHGAAVGEGYGALSAAAQDASEGKPIDAGQALQKGIPMGLIAGTAVGATGPVLRKLSKKAEEIDTSAKPVEPIGTSPAAKAPTNAEAGQEVHGEPIDHKVRHTPRQEFKSSTPEIKKALEAADAQEIAAAQRPDSEQTAPSSEQTAPEIMQPEPQKQPEPSPVAPENSVPPAELPPDFQGQTEPTPLTEKVFEESYGDQGDQKTPIAGWRASELTDSQLEQYKNLYADQPKSDRYKAVSEELNQRQQNGKRIVDVDGERHVLTPEQSKVYDELVNDHAQAVNILHGDPAALAAQFDAHDNALRDLVKNPPRNSPVSPPTEASSPTPGTPPAEAHAPIKPASEAGPTEAPAAAAAPSADTPIHSTPEFTETESKPAQGANNAKYTSGPDPNRKGYQAVFAPDGSVHSSSKRTAAQASKVAERLNSGGIKATSGAREVSSTDAGTKESTVPIFADGQSLPPDHPATARMAAVADAKHTYDEAVAKRNAAYDQFKAEHGLETQYSDKPEFRYDRELEKETMAEHPGQVGIEVQNSKKYSGEFRFKTGSTPEQKAARIQELNKDVNTAQKNYNLARGHAHSALVEATANGEIESGSVNIPHEKGDVNIRFVPNGEAASELRQKLAAPMIQEVARAFRDIKEFIGKANALADEVAQAVVRNDGVTLADPTLGVLSTVGRLAKLAKEKGLSLKTIDARNIQQVLLNQSTSDKYYLHGTPEFGADFEKARGALDLAYQGAEHLKTEEQHQAWMEARYDTPEEIRNGRAHIPEKSVPNIFKNYSSNTHERIRKTNERAAEKNAQNLEHNDRLSTLSDAQKEALIKSNAALDTMADLFEQQIEKLEKAGVSDEGLKGIVGQGNLLRTLKNDLKQLDPRRYYGSSDWQRAASNVTGGLYRMYVTGNWPIHQLHFLEAGTAGLSYDPIAFKDAVLQINTDADVKAYVNSFDASSGLMKQIKDENPTYGPRSVINKIGSAVGNDKLGNQIRDNTYGKVGKIIGDKVNALGDKVGIDDLAHKTGEVVEGSAAETQKVHVMRAMALNMAAKSMEYEGGGKALARDINAALKDDKAMDPEKRLEAAGRIVYHMNEMIGYSPLGYTDSNFFNRLSRADNVIAPLVKLVTPFTSTRTVQSRLMTKYAADIINKVGAKDYKGAAAAIGSLAAFHSIIALIGGRSAVPKEYQDALHAASPDLAKEVLGFMDDINILGKAAHKEVEHLTPSFFIAGHLGDSFPTQLANAISDAANEKKNAWGRMRGVATQMAAFGISTVGDRMGTSTILKFGKALEEGLKGERTQYAFKDKNTVDSITSTGITAMKLAKTLGANVKPGEDKSYLGKAKLSTNTLYQLYQTATAGVEIEGAELINRARDDYAFGEAIRRSNPEKYQHLQHAFDNYVKHVPLQHEEAPGFWQRHFDEIMNSKKEEKPGTEA